MSALGVAWQHERPPQQGGGTKEPPRTQRHVAAQKPASLRRACLNKEVEPGSHHRLGATWRHGSLPQQGGGDWEPPQAQSHVATREPASARRQSQGATTGSEPRGGTGACLSREAEPPRAWNHVVAREPASAGRWSQGATTGSEPRDGTGARLNIEAEPGSHHGPGVTWWHRARLSKEAGPWSQHADVDLVV
jgi:hypothetical protein